MFSKFFTYIAFFFGVTLVFGTTCVFAEVGSEMTLEGSLSLRDPFRRPSAKKEMADDLSNLPDLERYAVEDLKLVGVITGMKKNKALVTTPSGKMFIVTENMKIGTRRGYIRSISKAGVNIEERVLNVLGQEEKVEARIDFKQTGGGN